MDKVQLYPFRFQPIFQYRLWGGRHLTDWLSVPLPGDDPIGEAWLLSDRDDFPSIVLDGPLKGRTIKQLMEEYPQQFMGKLSPHFSRFPLLLKFLDAREMLSVQVHPSDAHPALLPPGERGKTEAWVVLDAGAESRIYAGLKPGVTADTLRESLTNGSIEAQLESVSPQPGDGFFLQAGTVHALGSDVVIFEVQQNSDVTFRLYDWDRVDAKTGKSRELHIEQALACTNFSEASPALVTPLVEATEPVDRERLFQSEHFWLWRWIGQVPFTVGAPNMPRVLVCIGGAGQIEIGDAIYPMLKGDVMLLPAVLGPCIFRPVGTVNLLEIAIPEKK